MKSYNLYNDGFDNYRMKEEIDGDYIKTADFKKFVKEVKKFLGICWYYEDCTTSGYKGCELQELCKYFAKIGV